MPQMETLLDLISGHGRSAAAALTARERDCCGLSLPSNLLELVGTANDFQSLSGCDTGPCVGDDGVLDDGENPDLLELLAANGSLCSDHDGPCVGDDAVFDDSIDEVAQLETRSFGADLGPCVGDDFVEDPARLFDLGPSVGDDDLTIPPPEQRAGDGLAGLAAVCGDLGPCVGDDERQLSAVSFDLGPCVGHDQFSSASGALDLGPSVGDDLDIPG